MLYYLVKRPISHKLIERNISYGLYQTTSTEAQAEVRRLVEHGGLESYITAYSHRRSYINTKGQIYKLNSSKIYHIF
jgi:hypothetical protein